MKRVDIKNCNICEQGVGSNLMFYRIVVETFILNIQAIQRQNGLEQMMGGNAEIAQAIGPDEDLAKCLTTKTLFICQKCMIKGE